MSKLVSFQDVINYVKYIKDISHELSVSSDVEKSLIKSNSRGRRRTTLMPKPVSLEQIDRKNACIKINDSIRQIVDVVKHTSDYGLFLGVGCLYGNINNKVVGGPLLLVEVQIEENQLFITNNTFANYKLISAFIQNFDNIDEESVLSILRDESIIRLVDELERLLNNNSYEQDSNELAKRCFEIIDYHLNLSGKFNITQTTITELLERKQVEKLECNILLDLSAMYILPLKVPHEISVYNSIKLLEDELNEQGEVKNELINILIQGALYERNERIYPEEKDWNYLKEYIEKYLPLELSSKQKEALLKALTSKISYIQGPPGTGKSYTITAMAILALLTGLKILIVSSKEPAVKVVAEKLEPLLSNELNVLPFIYITQEVKQRLRKEIERLLNIPRLELPEKLKRVENELSHVEKGIEEYYKNIKVIERDIEFFMRQNVEYIRTHKELEDLRKHFETNYYQIREEERDVKKENLNILRSIKSYLTALSRNGDNLPLSHAIYYYSALRLLHKFGKPILSKDFYRYYARTPEFVDLTIKIYEKYASIAEKYYDLNRLDINRMRENLKYYKNTLRGYTQNYTKLHNARRILGALLKGDVRAELDKFRRLLYFSNMDRIAQLRRNINFEKLLEVYPVWICEIRRINELLPMVPEVFDLVVIDEASQVNLPEILPVIYRGKRLCIVGDHKQLSLISTGLPLMLSQKFDEITWNKYRPGGLSYSEGVRRRLTVTKSSILDLIASEENYINVPQTMLNEHFRSMPALAEFTSKTFYNNKLVIMTKTPEKINILPNNLYPVRVSGKRHKTEKYVLEEAQMVVDIMESLIKSKSYGDVYLSHFLKGDFSIGVISPIRNQIEVVRLMMDNRGLDTDKVFLGTPEEAQGHEFDVSIITLSAGEGASKQHYENPNRFNVMTSRAKYFTFFVYSEVPANFTLTRKYLNHFGYSLDSISQRIHLVPSNIRDAWRFDESKFESEFEGIIYYQLKAYVESRKGMKIYNQVESCGRRLDFVLYNELNSKFVAVEVDGIYHFREDSPREYNKSHIERLEQLKRAGWNIINTQYYKWFDKYGRLLPEYVVKNEVNRIYKLLDEHLGD